MQQQIILLTGDREAPYLTRFIAERDPLLRVGAVTRLEDLMAALKGWETRSRLISFCSGVIVPASLIEALVLTPYNVHPGPPEYPGLHPEAFALADQVGEFGATAHEMTAELDAGPIVAVKRFEVHKGCERLELADLAYQAAVALFSEVASFCIATEGDLPRLQQRWSGPAKRLADYQALIAEHGELDVPMPASLRNFGQDPGLPSRPLGL